jgi:hypothetical protein
MFKKRSNAAEPGRAPNRRRYWSVMLVGEHGRVIPFKHFKGLVIAVAVALVLSQLAAAVIGIAYYQKHRTVQRLEQEIGDLRQQAAALRDEKGRPASQDGDRQGADPFRGESRHRPKKPGRNGPAGKCRTACTCCADRAAK